MIYNNLCIENKFNNFILFIVSISQNRTLKIYFIKLVILLKHSYVKAFYFYNNAGKKEN